MSGGEREIFFGLMKRQRNGREKFIAKGPAVPWTARRVVLVSAPANGLKRVIRVLGERSRHPLQRRRARARNGVAPQSAGSPSPASVKVARPERPQASAAVDLDFRHQTLAVRPETACGFGGAYRVFSRLAGGGFRRPDSAAGRSRRCPVWVCFLKPLRVKRGITAGRRRGSRQTAGSKQGRRGKEMRRRQRARLFRRRRRAVSAQSGR